MTHGSKVQLTERERATVARVLAQFSSKLGPIKIFGSRARGSARANSDLDLVVYPPAGLNDLLALANAFDDSDLPIKVDVVAWESIGSPALRDEIRQHAVVAPGTARQTERYS